MRRKARDDRAFCGGYCLAQYPLAVIEDVREYLVGQYQRAVIRTARVVGRARDRPALAGFDQVLLEAIRTRIVKIPVGSAPAEHNR